MAGVFKSLDKSDVRITPFRTYKQWYDVIINGSGSTFTVYKANYNPRPNHPSTNLLDDNFDLGNPHFTQTEPTTSNGQYQRLIHRSIDHLYYRDFYTNTKAAFGTGNINTQYRYLEDQAWVISMPQSRFGEMISTDSVNIQFSWSYAPCSGSQAGTLLSGSWTINDDMLGNLVISSSNYYSPYGQYVGGAYTNYTSSVEKIVVGEWPLDDAYKYATDGVFSITSSFNRGIWQMDSIYNNISVTFKTGSQNPNPSDIEFLGAVMEFSASLSSSITVVPNEVKDNAQRYNFENGDFSISMMVMPSERPTHTSGSILLAKQGPVNELGVDLNGDVYSYITPNKSPYRLSYTSGSCKVKLEKDAGTLLFSLTSSLSMSLNTLYHVVATKSGSNYSLYVNSASGSSFDTGSTTIIDKSCINLSNIYIGNSYTNNQGFTGIIDNIKVYKQTLSQNDINILHHTLGVGNIQVGNAFYNHGMLILNSIPTRYGTVHSVTCRGTHTIWENEISCTIGPSEFGMSSNPTLQEYDPNINQYVYRSFVTGSYFKPFVTTVGLYDDRGQLLIVGKLNTPIQLPDNVDTTIIIRYDK